MQMLARSAAAGVVGALIGIGLALLLPVRHSAPVDDPLQTPGTQSPPSATRDETQARQRTLDAGTATTPDTRPDDHTLARRDADRVRTGQPPATPTTPAPESASASTDAPAAGTAPEASAATTATPPSETAGTTAR